VVQALSFVALIHRACCMSAMASCADSQRQALHVPREESIVTVSASDRLFGTVRFKGTPGL
jgi:hypothetical protein